MNSEASRHLKSALAQSATARLGMSGARIRASSLAQVAQALHEHGLSATLHPTGSLHLCASTSRFTAHMLPGPSAAIEVRVQREGRNSILGLLTNPDEVAHLLIRGARMARAWELTADIYDHLVLAGETTTLAEVPMGATLFVRLGERTYAEFIADEGDACAGVPATTSLVTHIGRGSLDDVWRFRQLDEQDFPTMGHIAGGRFTTAETAVAALELHRARTPDWEHLH